MQHQIWCPFIMYLNYALMDLLQRLTTSDRVPLLTLSCKPWLLWGGWLQEADTNPDSTSSFILLPSLAGQGGGPTSDNTQTRTYMYKVGPPLASGAWAGCPSCWVLHLGSHLPLCSSGPVEVGCWLLGWSQQRGGVIQAISLCSSVCVQLPVT